MPTDKLIPVTSNRRAQRSLRLASGTALCMAASFGLDLPIPMVAPALSVFLFAMLNRPLPFKAG
ncbi:MAG: hypothetical protein QOC89_5264, partial [Paraburkholderia sp.]|uniref:DUF2955 domain-containing protein n=1 Tax=Paraburkholderia sp. TaxID=1926495 RepID=UPI002AFF6775